MEEQKGQEIPEGTNRLEESSGDQHKTIPITGMYESWFLDYASYVILERAVPEVLDGLKPVQRRILHAMKDLDDGRYNKVANIIGHTMKYHPHGDASIGDALVQLGQKDLLIDTQGNWGNVLTGDSAAAPRYIEARLSKFALEVVFNPKTTNWKASYDGRNNEPIALPVKFPLLLAQGVEGIAVGLASKILPHNFVELIEACIKYLKEEEFELYPDFLTGGYVDVTRYNNGLRGGKIRIRAKIQIKDKKTLAITEIPFGTTTSSLIDSIVTANEKGKIKIRKIDDNTAENVEILIHLSPGISPDQTIDALYAFTNCEMSISPNSCVIDKSKPNFMGVHEILEKSADSTVNLLKRELEIRLNELEDQWHFSSLEKIFIEERIYRNIENCKTWDSVIKTIDKGLKPFKDKLRRKITRDDIVRLTEIRIKRISKYSSFKSDEVIKGIELEIDEVQNHLDHLIDYAINYYKQILKKFGEGRDRKTEIRNFDTIEATRVAVANQKLYINRDEGFIGTSLRKDEYLCECSDIDDIIVIRGNGTFVVTKVAAKTFVGKDIIHADVFKKNDDRTIYNMIYRDGKRGNAYVKRFAVKGITRDRDYELTAGTEGSKVLYFTANPNGEAEVLKVNLRPKPRLRKTAFEFDFGELAIKGRSSKGNILSKYSIKSIVVKEEGVSTLGARNIWYDDTVKRLNAEKRGKHLGAFKSDDRIVTIMQNGEFKLSGYDLSTHFDEDMLTIEKFSDKKIYSVIYFDAEVEKTYLKRFSIDPETPLNKGTRFISEHEDATMISFSTDHLPMLKVSFTKENVEDEEINVNEFIAVKGYKAKGKRLSNLEIKEVVWLEPLPYEDETEENDENEEGAEASELEIDLTEVDLDEDMIKDDENQMTLDL